jgi:hypothetical protein
MPFGIMDRPSPNAGDDEEKLVDLGHLLAPRGLTIKPTDDHWKQASLELRWPKFKEPPLPGMWMGGRPPGADAAAHLKRVKQRAWELANSGQVIVKADDVVR